MAKKKKGSVLLWIIIIVLVFILFKDKIPVGSGSDKCGNRGVDEDRSGYCLTTNSDYDGLIIIAGNTANSPEPNLDFSSGELNTILSGVFYGDGTTTIISAAGNNPIIDTTQSFTPKKNLNASNNNLKKLSEEINVAIKQSPSESGANYFGAILKAGNEIKSKGLKRPIIVIVGSGYSDRGVLNFASDDVLGRYSNSYDAVGLVGGDKSVKEDMLSGATIKWFNAGVVSDPQSKISDHYQALTREIYAELFEYLGASSEILGDTGTSNFSSVDTKYTVGQVYVERLRRGDTFNVNEDVGKFVPDSNELINREEVKDRLRSFAMQFDNSDNLKLKVTGYIAICTPGSNLGEIRASTIRDLLVELGVSYDKIDVYGQPGAPSTNSSEPYTCDSDLPDTERRTVRIEVIEG